MCNKLDYEFNYVRVWKIQVKRYVVQKPWALDGDMGNKHGTESCQQKQGPTTLWTFYPVKYHK